jgi:sugar/nucleoside kinase (ribokinase family)
VPFDVIGIGENSLDDVMRVPSLQLTGGGKMRVISRTRRAGGQVATTMAACAALGLRTAYVGAFGDDSNGGLVQQALRDRGVDVERARVCGGVNRYAVIMVDAGRGERAVLWGRHPAVALTADDIDPALCRDTRLLHVDATDVEASLFATSVARAAGVIVTSDVDDVGSDAKELIAAVTIPILASHVAQTLTGERDVVLALRQLRQPHHAMLCVTRGEHGSVLLVGEHVYEEPAVRVGAVDTTGAGDVFRAGFIYALLRAEPPSRLLRWGNAAAAVSCTREGAIDSVPTLQEVEALLQSWGQKRTPE